MSDHRRFLVSPGRIVDGAAVLAGSQAHQITKVLRLREGERICLLDGSGAEYDARITSLFGGEVRAEVLGVRQCETEPRVRITLAICLPKGDKIEPVIQKCTELGISELVIVNSERTIAHLDAARQAERLIRWRRIAAEAVEQCGRGRAPEIRGVVEFDQLPEAIAESRLALVATEGEGVLPLREVLHAAGEVSSVMVVIGPEGGLTGREAALAESAGAKRISLGRRVLRCETAAIAACTILAYELDW